MLVCSARSFPSRSIDLINKGTGISPVTVFRGTKAPPLRSILSVIDTSSFLVCDSAYPGAVLQQSSLRFKVTKSQALFQRISFYREASSYLRVDFELLVTSPMGPTSCPRLPGYQGHHGARLITVPNDVEAPWTLSL
jgi:hypothetical protein